MEKNLKINKNIYQFCMPMNYTGAIAGVCSISIPTVLAPTVQIARALKLKGGVQNK